MKNIITVMTPTYNRCGLLNRLYNSLCYQTYKNFEWLVVDDGSTDNTKIIMQELINQNKIPIKYVFQNNGGKHRAINNALNYAEGELFFIVDSDDYLTNDALEVIDKTWKSIEDKENYCGVSGLRGCDKNTPIKMECPKKILDCSVLEFRYKYRIKGDMAEVFVTRILRENKFPEFTKEKFIPESVVWNKLGSMYTTRWINRIIYICEYLDNGLTSNAMKLRINNPYGTLLFHKKNIEYNLSFKDNLKNYVYYYKYLYLSNLYFKNNIINKFSFSNILGMILGIIIGLSYRFKIKYQS